MEIISKEILINYFKILLGHNNSYDAGVEQLYNKGDIMKYKNGNNYSFYRCKKNGRYSLPDSENFKKVLI